jgi:hypothetical protein
MGDGRRIRWLPNEPVIGSKNGRCSRSVTSKMWYGASANHGAALDFCLQVATRLTLLALDGWVTPLELFAAHPPQYV